MSIPSNADRGYMLVSRQYKPEYTVVDIEGVKIGGGNPPVIIAGPCSIESREHIIEIAYAVKEAGADILRGGADKPRSSPYSFQGIGEEGLVYLAEAGKLVGMPTDSEAVGEQKVDLVVKAGISIIHIGSRNQKSYELLKLAGHVAAENGRAVLLKRGEASTVDDFLGGAEYIAREGCMDIILCLRGIRGYENIENGLRRYTGDLDSIPVVKELSHLPVIYDPSHASGNREYVRAHARAAIAAGADGLMIETHLDPPNAKSDAAQQVTPATLVDIIKDARIIFETLRERQITYKN